MGKESVKAKTNLREFITKVESMESDYLGIELENEDEDSEMPYDVSSIRIDQKMVTVFQLEYWITNNLLNLQPEYQRNLVWDTKRKSALIESLLLRIPIPSFYLDEREDGVKNVIDGLQRLSTIHEYINNKFKLKQMQYLTSCENKFYEELSQKYKTYIMDASLAINTLDTRCPAIVKFDVFRKVNTGGLPLNPQEIRNIMAVPSVRELLKKMASCEEFVMATNGGINDIRMGAQELCLRYLTILNCYNWESHVLENYNGMIKTMDGMILKLNEFEINELDNLYKQFKKIMKQAHTILKENSFSKLNQKKINTALFTSWTVVLANLALPDHEIARKSEVMKRKYQKLLEYDGELYHIVSSSTGAKKNIVIAIELVRGLCEDKE